MVRPHQEERRRRTTEEDIGDGDRGKEEKTMEKVDGLHPRGHEPPGDDGGMDSRSASVEAAARGEGGNPN